MALDNIENYFLSADIGRTVNFSTLGLIARRWESPPGEYSRANQIAKLYCVMLRRFPLYTDYSAIEETLGSVWRYPELMITSNACIVDQTGVGAPVVEGLRKRQHIPVQGVVITTGQTTGRGQDGSYHVPKSTLVTCLVRGVQDGRVKILGETENAKELYEELQTFGYRMNRETGYMTYEAQENQAQDDLVIALALGVWYADTVKPSRPGPRDVREAVVDVDLKRG